MSYTPPSGNALAFSFGGAYTPPSGDALAFSFGAGTLPTTVVGSVDIALPLSFDTCLAVTVTGASRPYFGMTLPVAAVGYVAAAGTASFAIKPAASASGGTWGRGSVAIPLGIKVNLVGGSSVFGSGSARLSYSPAASGVAPVTGDGDYSTPIRVAGKGYTRVSSGAAFILPISANVDAATTVFGRVPSWPPVNIPFSVLGSALGPDYAVGDFDVPIFSSGSAAAAVMGGAAVTPVIFVQARAATTVSGVAAFRPLVAVTGSGICEVRCVGNFTPAWHIGNTGQQPPVGYAAIAVPMSTREPFDYAATSGIVGIDLAYDPIVLNVSEAITVAATATVGRGSQAVIFAPMNTVARGAIPTSGRAQVVLPVRATADDAASRLARADFIARFTAEAQGVVGATGIGSAEFSVVAAGEMRIGRTSSAAFSYRLSAAAAGSTGLCGTAAAPFFMAVVARGSALAPVSGQAAATLSFLLAGSAAFPMPVPTPGISVFTRQKTMSVRQ